MEALLKHCERKYPMFDRCSHVSYAAVHATRGCVKGMLSDLCPTHSVSPHAGTDLDRSTSAALGFGGTSPRGFLLVLSGRPRHLRMRAVPVLCKAKNDPSFEARSTLMSRCFNLLPSQSLRQLLEFLVQRLPLNIMSRGNYFHGHRLGLLY